MLLGKTMKANFLHIIKYEVHDFTYGPFNENKRTFHLG